jgi:aryl-alcohol dehydrogenase-like predicted oxidoreductase
VLPTAQRHGMGILTYSPLAVGWLSGRYGKDADASPASSARARGALAARFDMSPPENERKLDAVGALAKVADDAGLWLIELAIAFVIRHPGVTSAIIGPRTMEQLESQLPAAESLFNEERSVPTPEFAARSPSSPSCPTTKALMSSLLRVRRRGSFSTGTRARA